MPIEIERESSIAGLGNDLAYDGSWNPHRPRAGTSRPYCLRPLLRVADAVDPSRIKGASRAGNRT